MNAALHPMPAGREEPTAAQAEVLLAMATTGPTHVVEIASSIGVPVDAVRNRLYKLDRKHMVVAVAGEIFCNRWVLTDFGRRTRERLSVA